MNGPTCVLTVSEDGAEMRDCWAPCRQPPHIAITLRLAGVGVSVIVPVTCLDLQVRSELVSVSVDGVSINYQRSHTHEDLKASLQEVQIDNQCSDALYPVVLSRDAPAGSRQTATPLFKLSMCRRLDPDLLHFDSLAVNVQSLNVQLDTDFLLNLADAWFGFFEPTLAPTHVVPALTSGMENPLEVDILREGPKLHFNGLTLSKAAVCLTFSVRNGLRRPRGRPGDVGFWYRLAASVSSVDSSMLQLDAFKLENTTMSTTSFQGAVQSHYYGECLQELKSFVASLELLGNPRSLLKHFSVGCIDVCWEPYQGAMYSIEDALEGMLKGTVSCFRNVAFGASNAVAKMAGSASQGCSLCIATERPRSGGRQPRHVGEGLRLGAVSLAQGIKEGLMGLVLAPKKGYGQAGCSGLAWGCGRGILGVAAQPILGCLDLTKQTAEGIRNTAFSVEERQKRRIRSPRVLYGSELVVRPYHAGEARLKELLVLIDRKLSVMALVDYKWNTDHKSVAVISDKLFLYANQETTKVLMKAELSDIDGTQVVCNGKNWEIQFRMRTRSGGAGLQRLPLGDCEYASAVAKMLDTR